MKKFLKEITLDLAVGMIRFIMATLVFYGHGLIIFIFGKMIIENPALNRSDLALVVMCAFILSLTALIVLWHANNKDELLKKTFFIILTVFAGSLFCLVLAESIELIIGETKTTLWLTIAGCIAGIYVVASAFFTCPTAWFSLLLAKKTWVLEKFPLKL